jgi:hypothetical protein
LGGNETINCSKAEAALKSLKCEKEYFGDAHKKFSLLRKSDFISVDKEILFYVEFPFKHFNFFSILRIISGFAFVRKNLGAIHYITSDYIGEGTVVRLIRQKLSYACNH